MTRFAMKTPLSNRKAVIIAIAACVLISFLRWPELLLDAQFWGEDGWYWWPEARTFGSGSLLLPHTGYFQTDARMVALLASPFPLSRGPTLFALAALVFEVMPAAFLISGRCASLCPSLPLRIFIGFLWCAMPNTWEVHGNLTNSQWHLAVLSLLILISATPSTKAGLAFDTVMLSLGCVSGPFCIFLAPVSAILAWRHPSRTRLARLAIVMAGALIQISALSMGARGAMPSLGATPISFIRLMAGQVFLAPLVGHRHLPQWYATGPWRSGLLPWIAALTGFWLCIDAARRWPVIRLAGLFTLLTLCASLSHPVPGDDGSPVWVSMRNLDSNMRYLFLPLVFWMTVLAVTTFAAPRGWAKGVATGALLVSLFSGIPRDWRFPAVPDRHFYDIAREYDKAPPGTRFIIPVRPGRQAVYIK